jgi:hypothetical protein
VGTVHYGESRISGGWWRSSQDEKWKQSKEHVVNSFLHIVSKTSHTTVRMLAGQMSVFTCKLAQISSSSRCGWSK